YSMATHGWIYRGQTDDWTLKTSIERALLDWKIDFKEALEIEFQTIREFQRRTLTPFMRAFTTTLCSAYRSCSTMALRRDFWIVVTLHLPRQHLRWKRAQTQ